MGETPDEIKQEVEEARNRLGRDLNDLEYQVRRTLDWRTQFNRHPMAFIGAAFGLAFVIGLLLPVGRANPAD
jgi:ElaB/YqjD/DUF883 family membrane-anchored ribosome-binding protein